MDVGPLPPAEAPALDDREIELKLEVPASAMRALEARLKSAPGVAKRGAAQRLVSTYFDTESLDLKKAGVSLRIRRKGRSRVQTIKHGEGGAGLFDRSEWERRVASDEPSLTAGESAALATFLGAPLPPERPLAAVFSTNVRRTIYDVERGDAAIEVALDDAVVEAGDRRAAFCELEIELRAGEPPALFQIARELMAAAPLRLSVLAKSERGYAVLRGKPPRAVKAKGSLIAAGMTVEQAFLAVTRDCLAQFRRNEDLLLAGPDPDAVHQARVALRRLRSAFSLFKPAIADGRWTAVASELRWLAGSLGRARDLDVLLAGPLQPAADDGEAVDAKLAARVAVRRDAAYDAALGALRSSRALDLMIDLVEWTAIGRWRSEPALAGLRATPVEAFAAATLEKRFGRLAKKGKGLRDLHPQIRHEARIEAKKLRYASDFFVNLYAGGKSEKLHGRFVGLLADLQEQLGDLNDIESARVLTHGLACEAAAERDGDSAFSAGVIAGEARAAAPRLLAAAETSFGKLTGAKPFWR